MSNVNTVITAANTLFSGVAGIKRVYSEAPDTAPLGDLPCVIPISSHIGHRPQANGYQAKDFTVKYLLLVTPYSKSLVSMEKLARPFADLVLDVFFQHVKLNSSAIDHATMSDAVYGQITYNDSQDFLGWTFTLNATIKTTLAQGI